MVTRALYLVDKDNKVKVWIGTVRLFDGDKEIENTVAVTITSSMKAELVTRTGIIPYATLAVLLKSEHEKLEYFSKYYDHDKKYKLRISTPTIITKGTNLGKSNATNVLTQAISKLNTKVNTQKDKGYRDTIEIPILGNTITEYYPQKILKYANEKHNVIYPAFIQPKLNGERCIVFINEKKEVIMYQRNKIKDHITGLNPIREEVKQFLTIGLYLDCELYRHDITDFGQLTSMIDKSTKVDTFDDNTYVELHIFDIFDVTNKTWIYKDRYQKLLDIKAKYTLKYIKLVDTIEVKDEKELLEQYQSYIAMKYEGIIIRNMSGIYKFNTISPQTTKDVLKMRRREDDEFMIKGYTSGNGKFSDIIIWILETKDGKQFKASQSGDLELRRDEYRRLQSDPLLFDKEYKDKLMTVEYDSLSKDNIPLMPVAKSIRRI